MPSKVTAGKAIQQAPPASSRTQRAPSSAGKSSLQAFSPFSPVLGNQAMSQLLRSGQIHAKLRVSQPGDADEVEADRVAERVMLSKAGRASDQRPQTILASSVPVLHRKCSCSGGVKCAGCEEEEVENTNRIHRKSSSTSNDGATIADSPLKALDAGTSLDGTLRESMESRFGQDFSQVRIHSGAQAASAAQSINARAFTFENHLVFNQGEYAPQSASGQQLLAHELTHVVQQGASTPTAPQKPAPPDHHSNATLRSTVPSIQRSPSPAIMRTPLLNSTLEICHRVLKSKSILHVTEGGVVVTADADWGPSPEWKGGKDRPPECNGSYEVQLSRRNRFLDDNLDSCEFHHGKSTTRNWTNLPAGDYYLTISTNNTNPNCCLRGTIEASQQNNLTGPTCGGGPDRDYATMPAAEKISRAVTRSGDKFKGQLGTRIKELLTPESIAMMVAFAAAYVVSQTTPIGWVADVLVAGLIAATILMVGREAIDIVHLLIDFFDVATKAQSDADIDHAADLFAQALTKAGVDIVVAILFHKAGKAANLKPPGPRSAGLFEVLKTGGDKVMTTLLDPPEIHANLVTAGGPVPVSPSEVPGFLMMEGEKPGGGSSSGGSSGKGSGGAPAKSGSSAPDPAKAKPLPGKDIAAAEGLAKNLKKAADPDVSTEPSKKETGAQQEKRLLKEDRSSAGGRPANSATYYAYEGGSRGSFRAWAAKVKAHVDATLANSPNKPQLTEAPLAENTAKFIDRHPNLKTAWERMNLKIDTELKKIQTQKSAAGGDAVRIRELERIEAAIEKQRAELTNFESGDAGSKRPDLVELFFGERRAVVTDITQKTGDPLHNFKTEFYIALLKEILGWSEVDGVNYNTVYDQNISP